MKLTAYSTFSAMVYIFGTQLHGVDRDNFIRGCNFIFATDTLLEMIIDESLHLCNQTTTLYDVTHPGYVESLNASTGLRTEGRHFVNRDM